MRCSQARKLLRSLGERRRRPPRWSIAGNPTARRNRFPPCRCKPGMRTPLALLAIAAVALGPAAAASAKEIAVKVCGADGCHDVTDRATMAVTDGGPPTAWPDEPSPFYRVKISVTGEDGETVPGWTFLWVPAARRSSSRTDVGQPAEHDDRRADELTRRSTRCRRPAHAARAGRPRSWPRRPRRRRPPPTAACRPSSGWSSRPARSGSRPCCARRGVRARPPRGLRRRGLVALAAGWAWNRGCDDRGHRRRPGRACPHGDDPPSACSSNAIRPSPSAPPT